MSKIGKLPIVIPEWVEVSLTDNGIKNNVKVKWPKGELSYQTLDCITLKQEENTVLVAVDSIENNKFWGLTRSLIANMVEGVTKWFEKKIHIMGVGFGAVLQGKKLVLSIGFSHKVNFDLPELIDAEVTQDPKGDTIVTLTSIDKQLVGEVAAKIRAFRKPEPYKGKGIRYFGEVVKLKAGKAAKK